MVNYELNEAWEEVKHLMGYPVLKFPLITTKDVETASINMITKEIKISETFMKRLSQYVSEKDAFKIISAHEVSHHTYCPYDLKTLMSLDFEMTKIMGRPTKITNWFTDVFVNLDIIEKGIEINKAYWLSEELSIFQETIKELYTKKTGLFFGQKNKNFVNKEVLNKALKLDYKNTEINTLKDTAIKFAKIFSDIYSNEEASDSLNDYTKYSDSDVDDAFKDLVKTLSPEDFYEAIKYAEKTNITQKITTKNLKDYYHSLSKKYFLKIVKEKETIIGEEQRIKEWDSEDSISSINIYRSNAKFIPGISLSSKSYFNEYRGLDKKQKIPDALILLDSSASMDNPGIKLSKAVMAGFIISDFYLKNKKSVAVINFSSFAKLNNFSYNRSSVYDGLILYQGEYTNIDLSVVDSVVKNDVDIYLISDEAIDNYLDFESFIAAKPNIKNITVMGINSFNSKKHPKITRYCVRSEDDFLKFAVKDLSIKKEAYL